jgi:hypothetical protein
MLFGETVAIHCENHTERLCGQNVEFWYAEMGGTYSNHWIFLGLAGNHEPRIKIAWPSGDDAMYMRLAFRFWTEVLVTL